MARLINRVCRLERTHAANLRAAFPRPCPCFGGVDPATGPGPLRGCTQLDDELIVCRMCPRAWRDTLVESHGRLVLTGGVPTETPY